MKKNSREWLEKEAALKVRAMVSWAKSCVLKQDAEKANKEVQKFVAKYPDADTEVLPWEEREKCLAESEAITAALDDVERRLRELEKDYASLREDMNAFYGKEVMKPFDSLDSNNFTMPTDNSDPADWWKS